MVRAVASASRRRNAYALVGCGVCIGWLGRVAVGESTVCSQRAPFYPTKLKSERLLVRSCPSVEIPYCKVLHTSTDFKFSQKPALMPRELAFARAPHAKLSLRPLAPLPTAIPMSVACPCQALPRRPPDRATRRTLPTSHQHNAPLTTAPAARASPRGVHAPPHKQHATPSSLRPHLPPPVDTLFRP